MHRTGLIIRAKLILLSLLVGVIQPVHAGYSDGVDAFLSARYKDAMEHFREAIANNQNPGNSHYYIGKMFLLSKDPVSAYQNFLQAFRLGCRLDELGRDTDSAITQLLSSLPSDQSITLHQKAIAEGIYASTSVYYVMNQLRQQDAISEMLQLLKNAEESETFLLGQKYLRTYLANIYFWAANASMKQEKQPQALDYLRKSIRFDPGIKAAQDAFEKLNAQLRKRYQTFFDAAEKALLERKFDVAMAEYNKAMGVFPDDDMAKSRHEVARLRKASDEQVSKANEHLQQEQYEEAARLLRFAKAADPDNIRALNLLKDAEAGILKKLNLRENREVETEKKEQVFLASLASARNALRNEKAAEAMKHIETALQMKAGHPEAQEVKAQIEHKMSVLKKLESAEEFMRSQQYAKTYPILVELAAENPPPANLQALLAPCLFHLSKYEELLPVGKSILAFQPQNLEVLYYMAIATLALTEAGKLTDGMEQYESFLNRVYNLNPNYLDVSARLKRITRDRWLPVAVLIILSLIAGAFGYWWHTTRHTRAKSKFLDSVESLTRSENWAGLKELFKDFYSIEFDARETIKVLPVFMQAQVECQDYDEALATGNKILAVMPEHRQVKIQMARAYYGKGTLPANTLKYFKEILDSEYISDSFVEFIGQQIMDQDLKNDDTAPLLKRFVGLHPENDKGRKMLLDLVYKDKRMDKQVVELMQLEVQYNPSDVRYRLRLAEHFLQKKDAEECIRLCEEVINIDVTEKKLHGILIDAYDLLGQVETLRPVYEALLQTYPSNIVIQEAAAKVKLKAQVAQA